MGPDNHELDVEHTIDRHDCELASASGSVALPCAGKIWLDGWAGRHSYDVTVTRRCRSMFEVRNDSVENIQLAGKLRFLRPGQTVRVPAYAVTLIPPNHSFRGGNPSPATGSSAANSID